jgi:hypothetical protein
MTPQYAIADCERPLFCPSAAGAEVYPGQAKCYESFTLNALLFGCSLRTFAHVMTGRKPTSRTAIAGVFSSHHRAQTTIFALLKGMAAWRRLRQTAWGRFAPRCV